MHNYVQTNHNPHAQNLSRMKDFLKKPTTLIIAILSALLMAAAIVSAFVLTSTSDRSFSFLLREFAFIDYGDYYDMYEDRALTFVLAIPIIIFALFYAISFIMMYMNGKNTKKQLPPKGGVRLLFLSSILQLFISFIIFVFSIVSVIIMWDKYFQITPMIYGFSKAELREEAIMCTYMTAFTISISLIMFIHAILSFVFSNSLRKSLKGNFTNRGAMGYAILSALIALMFIGLMGFLIIAYGEIFDFIQLSLAILIVSLQAVFAFSYRNCIKKIKANQSDCAKPDIESQSPTYTQPQQPHYAPANKVAPQSNICSKCGSTYDDDSVFCGNCGYKLR